MATPAELRDALVSLAEPADQPGPDPAETYRRARQDADARRRRTWVVAVAAVLVLVVIAVGVFAAVGAEEAGDNRFSTDPATTLGEVGDTEVAPTTVPPTPAPEDPGGAGPEIVLGPTASGVTVGAPVPVSGVTTVSDVAVWIGGSGPDAGTITRLDPQTFEVEAVIPIPGKPGARRRSRQRLGRDRRGR